MKLNDMSERIYSLDRNDRTEVYVSAEDRIISATRTDKICPHDFAVGLVIPSRDEFYPTHVRLFLDLYLKKQSNPEAAGILFTILEHVYNGENPTNFIKELRKLEFNMQLDSAEINVYVAQLLMLEQDFNYGNKGCKNSKYSPPRLFMMSFIRWIDSEDDEIDKIITNAVRNWPPKVQYKQRIRKLTEY